MSHHPRGMGGMHFSFNLKDLVGPGVTKNLLGKVVLED